MPADPMLSRELKSLQEELSTSQRERLPPPVEHPAATAAPPGPPKDAAEEQHLRDEVRAFVDEVTQFFEETEKNIAAHPTASVIGAMVVGILIGRMLGRR